MKATKNLNSISNEFTTSICMLNRLATIKKHFSLNHKRQRSQLSKLHHKLNLQISNNIPSHLGISNSNNSNSSNNSISSRIRLNISLISILKSMFTNSLCRAARKSVLTVEIGREMSVANARILIAKQTSDTVSSAIPFSQIKCRRGLRRMAARISSAKSIRRTIARIMPESMGLRQKNLMQSKDRLSLMKKS